MATKGKGKKEHKAPPKACPRPVDLLQFPEIMAQVKLEWKARMEYARSAKFRKHKK